MKTDAEMVLEFRKVLGLTQVVAGERLMFTTRMVGHIESGRRRLGPYRRDRIEKVLEAFAAGGMEAVEALPAFAKPPRHRTRGGCRAVPPGDRDEMVGWRVALGLTQAAATTRVGLSVHSIRAIEGGRMRITDSVRANMESAERAGGRR